MEIMDDNFEQINIEAIGINQLSQEATGRIKEKSMIDEDYQIIWKRLAIGSDSVSNRCGLTVSGPGLDRPFSAVQFPTRSETRPALPWQGCYLDRIYTRCSLAGLDKDHGSILRFLQLSFQLTICDINLSWHDEYVDCAVLRALPPPAFIFAIRSILIESLWNDTIFSAIFASCR